MTQVIADLIIRGLVHLLETVFTKSKIIQIDT